MGEADRITQLLQTTPPACVAGFHLTPVELPIEWDKNPRSVWRLACSCGSEHGRILGYLLRDYNKSPNVGDSFISPIGFECIECGKITEVIDTDQHGYHPEVAKREGGIGSAVYRGEGPRTAWRCKQCNGEVFALTVAFIFWDAVFDLVEDEPDLPPQEFFTVFFSFAKCADCGHLSQPTDFGKL